MLLLAKEGFDVKQAWFDGTTPLWRASDLDHTEVVKLLLAKEGVDLNMDGSETTPLWIYCLQKLATTLFLILRKYDIPPLLGSTALIIPATAASYSHLPLQNPSKPLANVLSPFEIVFAHFNVQGSHSNLNCHPCQTLASM